MATSLRYTVADLEAFPQPLDDTRYEVIDGELYVTTQPSYQHQSVCLQAGRALEDWSEETGRGRTFLAPGVVFAVAEAVAPDVVWVSQERLPQVLGEDGKLHAAPDLMVEVVSRGAQNEHRDREVKLKMYSRRGVREYWQLTWWERRLDVYRRENAVLQLVATLYEGDTLDSPLLPGFTCPVARFFARI